MNTFRTAFAGACLIVLVIELYYLFINRDYTFAIRGHEPYEIEEFAAGSAVAHAFLMRGEGLHTARAQFISDVPARARLRWTIWRGSYDEKSMSVAAEGQTEVTLRHTQTWVDFPMTRDGSSKDRWYMLEVALIEAWPLTGGERPKVHALATRDNPDRGGVLWVGKVRQGGSLVLRAERTGRTLYRRFQAEAEVNLPRMLRIEAVQWLIALILHAAFFTHVFELLAPVSTRSADTVVG